VGVQIGRPQLLGHHHLNPKLPPPYSKLMLGLPTQSGGSGGDGGVTAAAVTWGGVWRRRNGKKGGNGGGRFGVVLE